MILLALPTMLLLALPTVLLLALPTVLLLAFLPYSSYCFLYLCVIITNDHSYQDPTFMDELKWSGLGG